MDPAAEHVYTPTELNREVRLHIEIGFPRILLEAEVSNLSRPSSGHLYFTLKDDRAQVRCALFRSAAARSVVRLENGMQVLARGRISLYEPRGDFQMIVDSVQEAGEGALLRRFEELKTRLESEGLFDPARKRALPAFPRRIALITSPGGAAVRDVLHVLRRRWPVARVRLYPVLVQGSGAPADIRAALLAANRHGWADLLICGRGGGSLEDLMAFNDEGVARAVHASAIPVVSAVGHETDFSICDFVADLRAPTPSAAAELATPDQHSLREAFDRNGRQLQRRLQDRLQRDAQRVDHLAHRLRQQHPVARLAEQSRRLDSLRATLSQSMQRTLEGGRQRLNGAARRLAAQPPIRRIESLGERVAAARRALNRGALQALGLRRRQLSELARTLQAVSPLATLGRGYAVITAAETGEVVSSVTQTQPGASVSARLEDGWLDCIVEDVRKAGESALPGYPLPPELAE
jgi:exodeoxyribonuclease VII large subunit